MNALRLVFAVVGGLGGGAPAWFNRYCVLMDINSASDKLTSETRSTSMKESVLTRSSMRTIAITIMSWRPGSNLANGSPQSSLVFRELGGVKILAWASLGFRCSRCRALVGKAFTSSDSCCLWPGGVRRPWKLLPSTAKKRCNGRSTGAPLRLTISGVQL